MRISKFINIMKCLLLSWFLLFSAASYSDNKILTIGIPIDGYAPYVIIVNGKVFGILIEPLQLAAENIGVKLVYKFLPEKRSLEMLKQNLIDGRMESSLWVENPEDYLWTEPVTLLEDVFVFHKASNSLFETDESIIGGEIVTHLGYSYPSLQPLFTKGVIYRNDFSSELEMLNSIIKPIDGVNRAAVMNKEVALWLINRNPKLQNRFLFSKRLVDAAPLQFQFNKNTTLEQTINQLNTELKKLKDDRMIA